MSRREAEADADVAVLGAGFAGLITALILARQGHRVVVIERGEHPRFAIGESGIKETSLALSWLAERYDLPELDNLTSAARVQQRVSRACGQKRSFSFLWHEEGEAHRPEHAVQVGSPRAPYGFDVHYYRQDVDQYLLLHATRRGVEVRQRTAVESVELDEAGATVHTSDGGSLRVRAVLDGTGFRSVLGQTHGAPEQPCAARTHSRALFTHMVGVPAYDDRVASHRDCGLAQRMSLGTLHHVFAGGWMWVIPFNNIEGSSNPSCSVGLCLDPRVFPDTGLAPAEEFAQVVARFPSVAAHLEGARPVRPWVGTRRLQYRFRRPTMGRAVLLPHAIGFVDPLFSRGLYLTVSGIAALAPPLLAALDSDTFRAEDFAPYADQMGAAVEATDRLVATSYRSFSSFELWNAWHRVWGLGVFIESLRWIHGRAGLAAGHSTPPGGPGLPLDLPEYAELFAQAEALVLGAEDPAAAAADILGLLQRCAICPPNFAYGDPARRFLDMTDPVATLRFLWWSRREAPADFRARFTLGPAAMARELGAAARWSAPVCPSV